MMVMPGAVIEGHAKYEEECTRCHQRLGKKTQPRLCLDCHEVVDEDVVNGKGYHGLAPAVKGAGCKGCHTEHVGRGASVIVLDRETFSHEYTDYALEGEHTKARCDSCHKKEKLFREAPSACIDCHKEDDRHDGELGEKCEDCHTPKRFKKARFDHEETDFPLADSHEDVACGMCHPGDRFKKTPSTCVACHRINDTHQGRYGEKCADCHSPKEWDKPVFDHDRDTKWPLEKKHRDVSCDACHEGNLYKDETPTTCHGCHRHDDAHKGRYGKKCETCHAPEGWGKAAFDHDDTDFPLTGDHQDVSCERCHRGDAYEEKIGTTCRTCHQADDLHKGQLGENCERCHDERGWGEHIIFDHDLTPFPLLGLHAGVPCEACHVQAGFDQTKSVCDKCHRPDDVHKKRLGTRCGDCHTPNGWDRWRFDHEDTGFTLDGAHEELDCHACHRTPAGKKVRQSSACGACHLADDIHDGRFGRQCVWCHTTEAFRPALLHERSR